MATHHASIANPNLSGEKSLQARMEDLLGEFYRTVGVAPRDRAWAYASDLLADKFEGRFFLRSSSELLCFDRSQILGARLGLGDLPPQSQLLSMSAPAEKEGNVFADYVAAFRYGRTLILRHGTLKAEQGTGQWKIRSVDEDIRTTLLPEARAKVRNPSDQPRIWFL